MTEINIPYLPDEKNLEWKYEGYSFSLAETVNKLLEIDDLLQISVNQARMDLIIEKQILSIFVEKDGNLIFLILLKKNEGQSFVIDLLCSPRKTIPSLAEQTFISKWCKEKHIDFSFSLKR